MMLKLNIRLFAAAILSVVGAVSCGSSGSVDYCQRLVAVAKDSQKSEFLIAWVDQQFPKREINPDPLVFGGGMIPGKYWYPVDFDWSAIGLSGKGQVRIEGERSADKDALLISSVSFNEVTRHGIVVRHALSPSFGISSENMVYEAGRIAVFCLGKNKADPL